MRVSVNDKMTTEGIYFQGGAQKKSGSDDPLSAFATAMDRGFKDVRMLLQHPHPRASRAKRLEVAAVVPARSVEEGDGEERDGHRKNLRKSEAGLPRSDEANVAIMATSVNDKMQTSTIYFLPPVW